MQKIVVSLQNAAETGPSMCRDERDFRAVVLLDLLISADESLIYREEMELLGDQRVVDHKIRTAFCGWSRRAVKTHQLRTARNVLAEGLGISPRKPHDISPPRNSLGYHMDEEKAELTI